MSETSSTSAEQRPEAVVIRVLSHDLDETHIAGLRQGITQALNVSPTLPFIIDLSKVKFVPSLTLGSLVGLAAEFRARTQRLILVSLQPTVRKVMDITRLGEVLEIMDDVPAALASVKPAGGL